MTGVRTDEARASTGPTSPGCADDLGTAGPVTTDMLESVAAVRDNGDHA